MSAPTALSKITRKRVKISQERDQSGEGLDCGQGLADQLELEQIYDESKSHPVNKEK